MEDTAQYRCRVDFYKEQTVFGLVRLVVVVPPSQPSLTLGNGLAVVDRLPVREGGEVALTCTAVGGTPSPSLTWWQVHTLLSNSA